MRQTFILLMLLVSPILIFGQSGTLDSSFGNGGTVTTSVFPNYNFVETTRVQTDGKILVAGNAGTSATYQMAIARYNTDGSLDSSFNGDGTLRFNVGQVKSFITDLVQQPDGKILIGGRTWDNVAGNFALVRLNEDGSFDNTFGTGGISHITTTENDVSEAISLLDDGKILMAGYRNNNFAVAKFNADGSVDTFFGVNGWTVVPFDGLPESYIRAMAIQNDDKIVVSGFSLNFDNRFQIAAARLNADGTIDNSFGTDGTLIFNVGDWNDFSDALALQADGKILIGGHKWIANVHQRHDLIVARLNTDGSLDTSYGNNGVATARLVDGANYASDMVLQSDEKAILIGSTVFEGEYKMAMARFNTDGSLDATFGPAGDGMVSVENAGLEDYGRAVALQADEKIILAGHAYTLDGNNSMFVVSRFLNDGMVGVEDFKNTDFRIYPNPAREQLTIEMNDASSTYQVEIYDMLGKKVYNSEIQNKGQINVSSLASGTYLVKLNSNSQTSTVRFVKL
ncbi:T9SS type A sorting domain-containing protein [Aequorivita sp. H23M31]|uniref:T9SS type A sorting domain-containing protein n=1 Tax=Aequorivita ciconiae TaxID=2494375 RepID=A0A410G552_9FLAO|nr:T9SS type A sorting domain-containing protein [Aequorivita sp. H23M31]QAA82406.1 T9SS type A sorting domain-containing protein [Aequorivita sp. H23M31]